MSESSPDNKSENSESTAPAVRNLSRRQMLGLLGVGINAIAGAMIAIPIIGYILAPASRRHIDKELKWVSLGELTKYPVGQTRFATYRNPSCCPWDGDTGNIPCWVRRMCRTSCRFLRSIAPIWAVPSDGFRSRDCSCARVMAAFITPMARAPRARPRADSFNTTTKLKTISSGSKRADANPRLATQPGTVRINRRGGACA